jgi:hypothetical protein
MEDTDVRFSSQSYTNWCMNLPTGFSLRNVYGRVTTCLTLKQIEALNNMNAKFVPRSRLYCRTLSLLPAQVAMAVSIHSVGMEEFIDRDGTKNRFSPPNFSSQQFLQKHDEEKA